MGSNCFSKNLIFLRSISNLSQQALADLIGVNRGNIDSYERGSHPKPEIMLKIANYFGIELQTIIAVELDSDKYSSLMKSESIEGSDSQENPKTSNLDCPFAKAKFMSLMIRIKQEPDEQVRSQLVDEALLLVSKLEDETNSLKSEVFKYLRGL